MIAEAGFIDVALWHYRKCQLTDKINLNPALDGSRWH